MTFVDFYICHRMTSLQKFYFLTLTYFFKAKNLKREYLRIGKMHGTTFVDFEICHRMVSLRKLSSVTLTYILKVNNLKQYL